MPSNFRVTTNGLFRSYGNNLHASQKRLSDHMNEVETGRVFQSYKEDPVAASKAFQLRRSYWNAGNQIDSGKYVTGKFQTAWDAIGEIVDGTVEHPGLSSINTSLRALNDPEAGAREVLGAEMVSTADSIALLMNARYVNEFVFAGADGLSAPFSVENGNVYYRNINVNATDVKSPADFGIKNADGSDMSDADLDVQLERVAQLIRATAYEETETSTTTDENGQPVQISTVAKKNDTPLTSEEFYKTYQDDSGTDVEGLRYEQYKNDYSDRWGISFDNRMAARQYVAYVQQIKDNYGDDAAMGRLNDVSDHAQLPDDTDLGTLAANLKADLQAIVDKSQNDYDALTATTEESTYVDIGLGFVRKNAITDGVARRLELYDVTPASAYDSALNGLNFLGYGTDEDGDPKNLVTLVHRLGEIFSRCDKDTGAYASDEDREAANRLTNKLSAAIDRVSERHVELDARVGYLQKNQEQLEEKKFNLNEQILETEEADMSESIMEMMWAQYSYNAALRIGNNILSQSLIDYMS